MIGSRGEWKGGMAFEIEQDGVSFVVDASPEFGGADLGPRPKGLLLSALIGCTGMDVVSILQKMRVTGFEFSLEAEGELTADHPVVFGSIRLRYIFRGAALPREKLERAVELSQEKYCGVSAILRASSPIGYEIVVEEA